MPATATYSPTGSAYVDGVLSGIKWGVSSLTFSFPANASYYGASYGNSEQLTNFKAFTTVQQAAVRAILNSYSAVANVAFTEVTESATVHGDLRYAESDKPGTAWAYYPSTNVAGGDAWFNNSTHWYDSPAKGNYAWLTMIHETGHAMGLKHPQDASGAFAAMPLDRDSLEYTVMSYRSYIGASTTTGYTNGSTSYPQTLMMYDIAGLQTLYGANYNTNAGDTVYKWSQTTGEMSINGVGQGAPAGNKIFMTIWDGGGQDTYDFSNYTTAVAVNLAPGGWTTASATQLASLGNGHVAVGNIANALLFNGNTASLIENAIGGSGADTLFGNVANNKLRGNAGNDVLNGDAGTDTAAYSGLLSNYSTVQNANGSWTVADLRSGTPDGVDLLTNIEYLQFADQTVAVGTYTPPPPPPPPPPPTNTAPIANNDVYSVAKGGTLVVSAAAGVLANDTDADGNKLSATLVTSPGKGSLKLNADGSFTYAPAKNFTGQVSFTYRDSDGAATSNTASVTINVGQAIASGRGRGAEGVEDMGDDQAPTPGIVNLADNRDMAAVHASLGMTVALSFASPQSSGPFADATLSEIESLLAEVGRRPSAIHGSGDDADITLTGLPDFLLALASEFHLAA